MERVLDSMSWDELCEYEQALFMKFFGIQVLFAEGQQLSLEQAIELCEWCKNLLIIAKRRQVIYETEADAGLRARIMEFYASAQFEKAVLKRRQLFDIYEKLLENPQISDFLDEQIPEVMMKTADPNFFLTNVNLLSISTETVLLWNELQNEFNELDSNIIYNGATDVKSRQFFIQGNTLTAAPTVNQWRRIQEKIAGLSQNDLEYFDQQLRLQFMWLKIIYQTNKTLLPHKARYFCYILKLYLFIINRRHMLIRELSLQAYDGERVAFAYEKRSEALSNMCGYISIYIDLYGESELAGHLDEYRPDLFVCSADIMYKDNVLEAMSDALSERRAIIDLECGTASVCNKVAETTKQRLNIMNNAVEKAKLLCQADLLYEFGQIHPESIEHGVSHFLPVSLNQGEIPAFYAGPPSLNAPLSTSSQTQGLNLTYNPADQEFSMPLSASLRLLENMAAMPPQMPPPSLFSPLQPPEIMEQQLNSHSLKRSYHRRSQSLTKDLEDSDDISSFKGHQKNNKPRRSLFKFTEEHEIYFSKLKQDSEKLTYVEIAKAMTLHFGVEFNCKQLEQRWERVSRPGLHKGHWDREEDDELKNLYYEHQGLIKQVQKNMPHRSLLQIRERCKLLRLL